MIVSVVLPRSRRKEVVDAQNDDVFRLHPAPMRCIAEVLISQSFFSESVDLCPIPSNLIGKRPALVLQLLVLLQLNAILRHDCDTVAIGTPRIPVEKDLHALLDGGHGLLPCYVSNTLLVLREQPPQQRLRQMCPEPRRQRWRAVGRAEKIREAQKRRTFVVEPGHEDHVPQRVEIGAALVEDFGEVGVEVLGVERVARRSVVFLDVKRREHAVDVLHVGDVAAKSND